MEKQTFRKKLVTPKHVAIAVSMLILFGLLYLNEIRQPAAYILILVFIVPALYSYKIDKGYLTQGNFVAIPVKDIEKLFIKQSGSVVIYYGKPYKDKEYTNTVHPVDTEGFVAALQQVNEEMTILRENS
ncbi:hypothetical protein H8788_04540 [Parabacteroides faecis]|uniref:hypothetical protein n=1 Tax=Parabacteroides TaxID=375288 RepID=UPI000EFEDCCA|nr:MULTISPECIES: hypothetical protein [Parabacteroides]MBC8616997.1 hypothetical protein [Parabacteroides faecis]RHR98021.1 hypothetical protein DWW23_12755 [Parabacteroides sp. AF14-59]